MKICSVCYRCYEDRAVECAEKSHSSLLEFHDGDVDTISGYRLETLDYSDAREQAFGARHIASERTCIVKIVHRPAERIADFLRDAEIATSLFHPNVVDIYETGQLENGDVFVVTEDCAGRTLRAILSEGTPDLMTAIRIATEAASAVHTMHLKSLNHRAIRPENIVIARDDAGELLVRIKDPDLGGLAVHAIVSDKFTIDSARHQLRYFAPEQCNGEPIGIKTDVYSLGIVLYEMLAGRPPFDSPKASGLIEMHRHRRPAEIRIDDFELRMLVIHTLMQSLSKHPSDRQSSANALARQLRHVEQLATHVSTPPPAGIIPPEPVRSSPRIHISDVGQTADVVFSPAMVKPDNGATRFVPKDEPRDLTEPAIETSPALVIASENAPPRQWLSRLKLQRKRSRAEGGRPPAILPDTATPDPAIGSQAFSLDKNAEKILKIGRDPQKVDWQQPDDDLPSMDAVIAARSDMSEPSETAVTEKIVEPGRIETPPEPVDLPRPARVAAAAASAGIHLSGIFGTSHHEADEITAAPARGNPIRIDIPSPRPASSREPVRKIAPSPEDESSYFPTLLGAKAESISEVASAPVLSSFYGDARERSVLPIQKTALAAGVVAAAAAIFAFSNASVLKNFSSSPVDDRVSVSTTSPDPSQQQPAVAAPQSVPTKKPLKYFDSPKPKADANTASEPKTDTSKPAAVKNQSAGGSRLDKKKDARTHADSREKVPAKPEAMNRGQDRTVAASNKPTATTRPRIVKNPRQ